MVTASITYGYAFKAPFALAALYAHPIEFMVADLIPFTAGFLVFRPHIFFVFMWVVGACLGTQTHRSTVKVPVFAALQLAHCALPGRAWRLNGSWVLPE